MCILFAKFGILQKQICIFAWFLTVQSSKRAENVGTENIFNYAGTMSATQLNLAAFNSSSKHYTGRITVQLTTKNNKKALKRLHTTANTHSSRICIFTNYKKFFLIRKILGILKDKMNFKFYTFTCGQIKVVHFIQSAN